MQPGCTAKRPARVASTSAQPVSATSTAARPPPPLPIAAATTDLASCVPSMHAASHPPAECFYLDAHEHALLAAQISDDADALRARLHAPRVMRPVTAPAPTVPPTAIRPIAAPAHAVLPTTQDAVASLAHAALPPGSATRLRRGRTRRGRRRRGLGVRG